METALRLRLLTMEADMKNVATISNFDWARADAATHALKDYQPVHMAADALVERLLHDIAVLSAEQKIARLKDAIAALEIA